jgi:hypothetical protein
MSTDQGFKLLAIRPLEGCNKKYLKNLKAGMVYKFYRNYIYFIKDGGIDVELTQSNYDQFKGKPISKIESLINEGVDLYSHADLKINISAVVGTNGSGKSSLVELFYKYLFDLSISTIKKRDPHRSGEFCIDLERESKSLGSQMNHLTATSLDTKKQYYPYVIEDTLDRIRRKEAVEFENNKINKIQNENKLTSIRDTVELIFEINGKPQVYQIDSKKEFPFYSISINHSAYSLNSEIIGVWIEKIFHKNDGYETPVVINPMRTNGDININNEFHLNKSRLLLNLDVTQIIEKTIESTNFKRIFNNDVIGKEFNSLYNVLYTNTVFLFERKYYFKSIKVDSKTIHGKTKEIGNQEIESSLIEFSKHINSAFPEINQLANFDSLLFHTKSHKDVEKNILIKIQLFRYLQHKFIKYARFKRLGVPTEDGFIVKDFLGLLKQIKMDFSHQTFKIYQILHLLHESNFKNFIQESGKKSVSLIEIDISISNQSFKNYLDKFQFLSGIKNPQEIWKVPAAFFSVGFKFQNQSEFEQLSSGEIQMLNSVNQVTYHLRNIESIQHCYSSINIIFDEVELYFHVDYQRVFISKLIESIKLLKLKRILNINIQFLTHSPFILSDIPSQNVLRLENGVPSEKEQKGTFGANLHDLLFDSFFLEEGFMGKFAEEKINEVINRINFERLILKIDHLEKRIDDPKTDAVEKEKLNDEISKARIRKMDLFKGEPDLSIDQCIGIIGLIGEPALQSKLGSMIYDIKKESDTIAYLKEIEEVKKKYGKF